MTLRVEESKGFSTSSCLVSLPRGTQGGGPSSARTANPESITEDFSITEFVSEDSPITELITETSPITGFITEDSPIAASIKEDSLNG